MLISEAVAIERLRAGEVVALPTDTVYGLCVSVEATGGTAALFAVKARPVNVALPVLVAEPAEAIEFGRFTPLAQSVTEAHWPGALTVVVERSRVSAAWDLGGDGATIGLRCPDDVALRRVIGSVGPLAVTSANVHGAPPCTTAAEVEHALPAVPVLDGGRRDGTPSTVVDLTGETVVVLRHGGVTT